MRPGARRPRPGSEAPPPAPVHRPRCIRYHGAMAYAIYRCEKLKTLGAIRASAAHNARSRQTRNADPSLTFFNEQLVGFAGKVPTPEALRAEWERLTAGAKRKRDAVLVQELFLGSSPEFFNECADYNDRKRRLQSWKQRAVKWLGDTFGALCFSATLHCDETTPHIAAYVVPLKKAKDGSTWLSAKTLFNPTTLRRQQDTYAGAVADLGLERGIRGSLAKHTEVRAFYGALTQPSSLREIDRVAQRIPLDIPERRLFQSAADYRSEVKTVVASGVGAIRESAARIEAKARSAEMRRRQANEKDATNKALSQRLAIAESELKGAVAKLRDIPLDQVLSKLGFGDGQGQGEVTVWETGDHTVTVKDQTWNDEKTGKRGRKAIDLVCHLLECGYVDAVAWLAGQWPPEEVANAVRAAADEQVAATPKKTVRTLWDRYAKPNVRATELVQEFLRSHFHISDAVLQQAFADGRYCGSFQQREMQSRLWCVFNHWREDGKIAGGSLLVAQPGAPITRVIGNRDTAFFCAGPSLNEAGALALVEDPISALSYLQLHPTEHVLSMAGFRVRPAIAQTISRLHIKTVFAAGAGKEREDEWIRVLRHLHDLGVEPSALLPRFVRAMPFVRGSRAHSWNDALQLSLKPQPNRPDIAINGHGSRLPLHRPIVPPMPYPEPPSP
jgi:hypothetical protein